MTENLASYYSAIKGVQSEITEVKTKQNKAEESRLQLEKIRVLSKFLSLYNISQNRDSKNLNTKRHSKQRMRYGFIVTRKFLMDASQTLPNTR
jgi:hypothetical protein